MMKNVCVSHCRQLMLSSTSEQRGLCLAVSQGCQQYRKRSTVSADRQAIEGFLHELFDVDTLADNVDLVSLAQAVHDDDDEQINILLHPLLSHADWVQLDDIGIGYDWGGIKVAVVCAATHPHLQAAVGVVIGADQARLTLGHIEKADAALMG